MTTPSQNNQSGLRVVPDFFLKKYSLSKQIIMKNKILKSKIQEITVKAIVVAELNITDSIKKILEVRELKSELGYGSTFYITKNNEIKQEFDIIAEDYPIRLVSFETTPKKDWFQLDNENTAIN